MWNRKDKMRLFRGGRRARRGCCDSVAGSPSPNAQPTPGADPARLGHPTSGGAPELEDEPNVMGGVDTDNIFR